MCTDWPSAPRFLLEASQLLKNIFHRWRVSCKGLNDHNCLRVYIRILSFFSAINTGKCLIRQQEIECEKKWQQASYLKTGKRLTLKGKRSWKVTKKLISCLRVLCSVSHPFLGDYVRLRQNVQWKKICVENNDQYVVFADIINKIARSSGKVCKKLLIWCKFGILNIF